MTFEEWLTGKMLGSMELEFARDAWNAATLAEREACAKLCETAEVPIDIDVWMGTKKALTAATAIGLATAMRKRSNAEIVRLDAAGGQSERMEG